MSVSTAGALKAKVEGLGLSLTAYRDRAPEKTPQPYVVISESLATVPDQLEDGGIGTGRETVSIDLFQQWKDPTTGAVTENRGLTDSIVRGLQGQRLPASPTLTYAVLVRSSRRLPTEEETNLVHSNVTAEIWRVL